MKEMNFEFQFPSNGKVDPNSVSIQGDIDLVEFQFPSNGKVDPNFMIVWNEVSQSIQFQFPSNGKVDPNFAFTLQDMFFYFGFNSLQTGKWILTL